MDKVTAEKILHQIKAWEAVFGDLDGLSMQLDEQEARALRNVIGTMVLDIHEGIIRPIVAQHPELDPDGEELRPDGRVSEAGDDELKLYRMLQSQASRSMSELQAALDMARMYMVAEDYEHFRLRVAGCIFEVGHQVTGFLFSKRPDLESEAEALMERFGRSYY